MRILLLLASVALVSCTVGPKYQSPQNNLETSFKNAGFRVAPPEGSWWKTFKEAELNGLISQCEQAPNIRAALARYDQARGALGLSYADAYPTITGDAFGRRQRDSGRTNFSSGTYNDYRAGLNLFWEIDFWGRVRRQVHAAAAESEATRLDLQAALLSLRGEVARTYFSLRFADAEIGLLNQTAALRQKSRRLMKTRFERGADSRIDYERSITAHESIVAELIQLQAQRGRFENALAALTGRSASTFRLAAHNRRPIIPRAPSATPSELLRRRPDLAASERRLAAASERIGVAIANFLPRLTLTGQGGVRSLQSSELFNASSRLWSLGPELSVPLFQGPRGGSTRARAEAAYREALANYRAVLLRAVQETEDSLGDERALARAAAAQQLGAASAKRVADLARKRHDGGLTDYFELVEAERTSLQEQRTALAIDLSRALATTRLIEALGGGWRE